MSYVSGTGRAREKCVDLKRYMNILHQQNKESFERSNDIISKLDETLLLPARCFNLTYSTKCFAV